ncbi:Scw11p [Sugiyamaella lignohabitans]|uniref:Scw11p n=1 Tax=Sugiyamaella lignohabitans TaxID=796027 RepID=A0A161HHN0_9ASCO|nr:Scw11p [Sugiyamaella lignohabitans]ANB15570.1 Scw11p [Sugiyamaella lignohabitans]
MTYHSIQKSGVHYRYSQLRRNKNNLGFLLIALIVALIILRENLKPGPEFETLSSKLRSGSASSDLLELDEEAQIHTDSGLPVPWAVSYSPYTSDGSCKRSQDITKDLNSIADIGTKAVRLFSSDCEVLESLSNVRQLRVILGIHPHSEKGSISELTESLDEQMDEITRCKCWSNIDMLVVGSQGVFAELYTRADLVKMLRYVRSKVSGIDAFQGLLSTAEPVESYISSTKYNAVSVSEYKKFQRILSRDVIPDDDFDLFVEDNDLCSVVDVIGLVVQPYFNSAIDASEAGSLVSRDVRFAKHLCSDKFIGSAHTRPSNPDSVNHPFSELADNQSTTHIPPVAVLEAGWPSSGEPNGQAIASPEHQKIAFEELLTARDLETNERIPVSLYTFQDELWRDPGPLSVETSFGISNQYL